MAAKARTEIQRERDLVLIADMYLRGKTQQEIADTLTTVSRSMVSRDLTLIRERWRERAVRDFDAAVAEELAKIDKLELMYLDGWERSQRVKTVKTKEQVEGTGARKRLTEQATEEIGDIAFLQGVERCVEKRIKLLGLNAPERMQVDSRSVNVNHTTADPTMTPAELDRQIQHQLAQRERFNQVLEHAQTRVIDVSPALLPEPVDHTD